MDVKGKGDSKPPKALNQLSQNSSDSVKGASRQKLARSLASAQAVTSNVDVKVEVSKRNKTSDSTELRSKANTVINAVNVAEEATAEIEKLVKSVGGIVDQAEKEDTSNNRRSILENEAQQLVAEIKKQSQVEIDPGKLKAEAVADERFKIEATLEQSLNALFKEGATSAFGISEISLGRKESIIDVRASIQIAKDRVSELRGKLSEAKEQVQSSVVALEVALENSQSATTSLRDVDEALKLATDTGAVIGQQQETAVNAQKLTPNSLDLLQ